MTNPPPDIQNRVAYDFAEFAGLFGRDRAWTYRLVRQGKLKPLLGYGNMMIPASEVDRMIAEAQRGEEAKP